MASGSNYVPPTPRRPRHNSDHRKPEMPSDVCLLCATQDAVTASFDDDGNQVLYCGDCEFGWTPTQNGRSYERVHANEVGKLLRRQGLHRDYGQDGPDSGKDGGPGTLARGAAIAYNDENYDQGNEVVYVDCDNNQTAELVRDAIYRRFGYVIQGRIENRLILERK